MARGRNVFLCYRREDTAGITGRLKDRLDASGFTAFMDTEDISSGYGLDGRPPPSSDEFGRPGRRHRADLVDLP